MNSIIRKFNQNRNTILLEIFIVISVIVAIQFVNSIIKKQNQEDIKNDTEQNLNVTKMQTPILTDKKVSKNTTESNIKIIEEFIKLCNEKKPQEAYKLISDDCKTEVFQTDQIFINNYYSKVFTNEKKYKCENWISQNNQYTYKIKFYNDDLLSTGGKDTKYIEEYYTIVRDSDKEKLNINNFINKKELNVEKASSNISINVKEQIMFSEYQIFSIEVKNNTIKDIMLDSKEKTNTMYIIDKEGNKYVSYSHEIANDKLLLRAGEKRTIKIKYNKSYTSDLNIESIVFSDIIIDYNDYQKNNGSYTKRESIKIDI